MKKYSKNQSLRINYYSSSSSFNPHLSKDILDSSLCKALYEGLCKKSLNGKIELAIAEKLAISEDKKKYTFTLKNTRWSNGEKVTSHHFVDAFKRALDPQMSKCLQTKMFFYIKNSEKVYKGELGIENLGIHALNEKTLVIELEWPTPSFLELLTNPVFSPIYDLDEDPTVFNGPFIIKNLEKDKQLTLVSNPFYWDKESIKLKEIKINFIKDEKTALSMFKENNLDWIGSPFTCITTDAVNAQSHIKSQATCSPFWIFFNCENPKFKSINIRKALSFAVNRSEIVKSVVPYQKELFTILPTEISQINEKSISDNYNIDIAKELFEKGLNELEIAKDDFFITLDHSSVSDHEKIAEYLKHRWEKAFGIKVILKKSDWNTFYSGIRSGQYEIGGFYVCNVISDPMYLLETFKNKNICYSKWDNENYQNLIELAKNSLDEKKRALYLKKAEELLLDEMPVIPLYNQSNLYLCKDNLKNLEAPKFSYMDFRYAYFE